MTQSQPKKLSQQVTQTAGLYPPQADPGGQSTRSTSKKRNANSDSRYGISPEVLSAGGVESGGVYPGCFHMVDVLRRHASQRPELPAFVHLSEDRAEEAVLDFAQFDRRAQAIAAMLLLMNLGGEPVLLSYPPGLDFIIGFFACLYAGCIAVPTHLPRRRTLDRFLAIAADAGATVALSTEGVIDQFQTMLGSEAELRQTASPIQWIGTDRISDAGADQFSGRDIDPDSLAMLQYTSGSTSLPKGVMISHSNLYLNACYIHRAFGVGPRDTGVSWLPAYHDMGLVGGVLEPVIAGLPNVLMAPNAFLQKPYNWLAAISKYKATISGGPNFAYDYCARKITAEEKATLDLSSWAVAFTGAEPIIPETLERFATAFAPCGFKASAFYPCYGLAEATLMVSGPKRADGATSRLVDGAALSQNRIESPVNDHHAHRLAASGSALPDLRVVIVEPEMQVPLEDDRVGEIWVAGPSIGKGYWRNPAQTLQSFGASLPEFPDAKFLRTGDLGFMSKGQLFVTGRVDDLIIVRGLNHYPQDLESTAKASHELVETGCGTAFSLVNHVDLAAPARLVLIQEVVRNGDVDLKPVLEAIRASVLEVHGLALDTVVLVRIGTVPKTSSGKVRRRACRAAFLAGELKAIAQYLAPADVAVPSPNSSATPSPSPSPNTAHACTELSKNAASATGLAVVIQHARSLSGQAIPDLSPETSLSALGLDSLRRLELVSSLEKTFGGRLPDAPLGQVQTLGELASLVQMHLLDGPRPTINTGEISPETYDIGMFPEYAELKRQERLLEAVAGTNPYFRADAGGADRGIARIDGRDLVNFCVYDYIGMARDPQVAAGARDAIDRYGTSAGASRLVSGEKVVHRELEQGIARFLGTEAALVFVSGHATNVTTIGHLLGPADLVVYDALAHNSILQGARLSGATARAFSHNDWQALDAMLTENRSRYRRVMIAIEGVYSMDGDWADLPRFIELKKKHKALLLVDEAHSLGTMGATGRGIGEHFGANRADVDLWMGTLSKSLASCGGYIAGSTPVVELLKYTAPGFVYSVGLSPPNAASALAALGILESQPQRVSRLRELSSLFLSLARERGLNTGSSSGTPVIPVILGSSIKSLRLSRALFERGINVQPILHPAVPEHAARLRFFITTNHTPEQIRSTVDIVAEELAKL